MQTIDFSKVEDTPANTSWKVLSKSRMQTDYKPISDYGIIGDQKTCALVGIDGSIDWLCVPRFDSPSVFAAILDMNKGGSFRILPNNGKDEFRATQYYKGLTNILITEFKDDRGHLRILDFMPCFKVGETMVSTGEIHRRISCLKGKFGIDVFIEPRMDYGRLLSTIEPVMDLGFVFDSSDMRTRQQIALITLREFQIGNGTLHGNFEISLGDEPLDLVFRYGGIRLHHAKEAFTEEKLKETHEYWQRWADATRVSGKWKNELLRSALVLKLLVYSTTGAIVAAPTTSLPEEIHGIRNWDYRFSWIRDSSFVLWAFHSIGHDETEELYVNWLTSIYYLTAQNLQVMLGISGERDLKEMTLDHLEGYKKSSPVRVGNAAWEQFQLDVYGITLDAIYFSHKHRGKLTQKVYDFIVKLIIQGVEDDWNKPDSGIWEVRGEQKHFVYSKMWCWVALDRAIRIAQSLGMTDDVSKWTILRDKIKDTILERGWDGTVNSFVRSFGSTELDAANLLMPQVRFIDGRDPKMIATLDATMKSLLQNGKFLYRYRADDGLPGNEGAFLICSFWLVSCLTFAGRLDEAEKLMDSLVQYSNHLGLFSEAIDPNTGEMLGNFPQAFTHMGFITAANSLTSAMEKRALEKGAK